MEDEVRYIISHGLDNIYERVFEEYPDFDEKEFYNILENEIKHFSYER